MISKQTCYGDLIEAFNLVSVCNTHSHHLPDHMMARLSLFRVLKQSYVSWMIPDFSEDNLANRKRFFDFYQVNSYSLWLVRAIEQLYPVGLPLSVETWSEYDTLIQKKHQNQEHHLDILKKSCRYDAIILDRYDDPGSDNGHPELFRPTYRCDAFFNGHDPQKRDHNGISPYDMMDVSEDVTLPEYMAAVRQAVQNARDHEDNVAIKIAVAYERDLYFSEQTLSKAAQGFRNRQATSHDIRAFQDYLMDQLMKYAAEFGMPVQIHTGLGQLKGTRAMALCDLIERHPDVSFDLFHASFPWTDDVLALAHNYSNVYVDLCWLPIISTTRAVTFLKEALEVTDAKRIIWGCDTWTSEESFGALMAVKHVLSAALSDLVMEHRFSIEDAVRIGSRVLSDNTAQLFKL